MHGYAADLQMKQDQNHIKICEELQKLREQNARLELTLAMRGPQTKGKVKHGMVVPCSIIL